MLLSQKIDLLRGNLSSELISNLSVHSLITIYFIIYFLSCFDVTFNYILVKRIKYFLGTFLHYLITNITNYNIKA